MTDQQNANPSNDTDPKRGGSWRRVFIGAAAAAGVTALVVGGAVAVSAHGGKGHGGWHGPVSIEAMQDRAERKLDRMLDKVDANDAQKQEIQAIAAALIEEVHPTIDQHRENRRAFFAALTGAEVDHASIERLRAAEMALLDDASADVVDALARAADVLTPEQRQQLAEWRGRHHRRDGDRDAE